MAYAGLRRVPAKPRAARFDRIEPKGIPAPTKGWVSAVNLAAVKPGYAYTLENWFPTTTGMRLRKGNQKYATCGTDPTESMLSYVGSTTRKVFAAMNGSIFNHTSPASPTVAPTAEVTGQSSDYYAHLNFATAGGNYMTVVNGTDSLLLYDGTNWFPITGTALSALNFDAQTVNFVVGGVLTGGTSGATATIVKNIDAGSTGTLWIRVTAGTFQDNEIITGSLGGSATANGVISALAAAITGATTSTLVHVWSYRNRQWFIQKDTMKAWYLPVDAIGGALASVSLSGVFQHGGTLVLGATWSMDSGDGLDDKIVFISSEGEYAVYQGSDPSDPDDWSLVGRYDGAVPLGRNQFGTMRAGADLLILTVAGIIPMTAIITKDPAALSLSAVSKAIEPDWVAEASARRSVPWEIIKWPSRQYAMVNVPVTGTSTPAISFVVNLETGAWCKYTGWDTRCLVLHDDGLYFGANDGAMYQAEITGADAGALYYSTCVWHADHLGAMGYVKTVKQARATFRTQNDFTPKLSLSTDYIIDLPVPPNAATPAAAGTWDSGLWDVALWDSGAAFYTVSTKWVSIGKTGYSHAMQLQVTNGAPAAPTAELILVELTYERGGLVV